MVNEAHATGWQVREKPELTMKKRDTHAYATGTSASDKVCLDQMS